MSGSQFGLFGTDPWWLVIGKAVAVFALLVLLTLFTIWWERRVVSRMQNRVGPNRVGPFGLLQSLMDGFKLAFKEEILPKSAHVGVYWIAPVISATAAFVAFAVIPFGPTVSVFGVETPLQLTDFPVSVLYVLAIASIGVYGLVLAGWASGSTYPLLGGLRSTAQVISYEIAMGLSFVGVFLYAGSMSTSEIVIAQEPIWYAVILLPSFLIYVTSMVGETNRAPFDLPEAEGELVGGFHTEYSSLKFAMFFLAEYINMVTVSALATTLFLGGYLAPWPLSLWESANTGWWPVLWWLIKVQLFIFLFIWLRATLPRMRYDQFMKFGWKVLIPVSILWIVIIAVARLFRDEVSLTNTQLLIGGAIAIVVLLGGSWLITARAEEKQIQAEKAEAERVTRTLEAHPSGYPVPPLPGQRFEYTSRRAMAGAVTSAAVIETVAVDTSTDTSTDDTTDEEAPHA